MKSEAFDETEPLTIFHPVDTWKTMTLTDYRIRPLHVPIFRGGEQVYTSPPLEEIRAYHFSEMDTFWDQYKRNLNPHVYKVDLSDGLWMLKQTMLKNKAGQDY